MAYPTLSCARRRRRSGTCTCWRRSRAAWTPSTWTRAAARPRRCASTWPRAPRRTGRRRPARPRRAPPSRVTAAPGPAWLLRGAVMRPPWRHGVTRRLRAAAAGRGGRARWLSAGTRRPRGGGPGPRRTAALAVGRAWSAWRRACSQSARRRGPGPTGQPSRGCEFTRSDADEPGSRWRLRPCRPDKDRGSPTYPSPGARRCRRSP